MQKAVNREGPLVIFIHSMSSWQRSEYASKLFQETTSKQGERIPVFIKELSCSTMASSVFPVAVILAGIESIFLLVAGTVLFWT